jgi:CDP-glucose 4,6-dehydratase
MAAQSLVRQSYDSPIDTFTTNIIGTINVFEAIRKSDSVEAIINVTTDKCYENQEWIWPYRENDRLGGNDPYSSSKACAELITATYRKSFLSKHGIHLASVRAGNVVGGGDWAKERLIPDFIRAWCSGTPLKVRAPSAVRPWQHVLEPLSGYLILAEKLVTYGQQYAEAWNFGPEESHAKSVSWILENLSKKFPSVRIEIDNSSKINETNFLMLESSKAKNKLAWRQRWPIENALEKTLYWYESWLQGKSIVDLSLEQIEEYSYVK